MQSPQLTLSGFTEEVSPIIVGRGLDYLDQGRVTSLEETESGHWVARVRGTTEYTVEISLSNDDVTSWICTCPYDYGPVCKHVVAVLCALEDRVFAGSENATESPSAQSTAERFQSLVERADPADLRKFLSEYARYHPEIRRDFLAKFTEADAPDAWRDYAAVIRESARAGAGRHGFIDYSYSFQVMQPVHKMLQQAYDMLEHKDYQGAWHIARAVMQEVPKLIQRMDDSGGDGSLTTDNALDILREIGMETDDDDLQSDVFNYLIQQMPKNPYTDFGFDDGMHTIATEIFRTPKQANRVEQIIDARLEEAKQSEDEFGREFKYNSALKHKIRFLEQTDRTDEVDEIIDAHLDIDEFRERRIREAIDSEDFERAQTLVQERIDRIKEQRYGRGFVYRWEQWLFRIAEAKGDTENIRRYAQHFFLNRLGGMPWYETLKSTYSEEKWSEILAGLLRELGSRGNSSVRTLAEVYVTEHRLDDLLKLLQNNPELTLLQTYSEHLADEYPDEVLVLYGRALRDYAKQNTGRKYYRQIVRTLNGLRNLPGGAEFVQDLVAEFRETYTRRPAMQEELGKVE